MTQETAGQLGAAGLYSKKRKSDLALIQLGKHFFKHCTLGHAVKPFLANSLVINITSLNTWKTLQWCNQGKLCNPLGFKVYLPLVIKREMYLKANLWREKNESRHC